MKNAATPPKLDQDAVVPILAAALKEDVGSKDLTTVSLVSKSEFAKGELIAKAEGVIAGLRVAEWTFERVEPKIGFKPTVQEGQFVFPGKAVAFVEGPARGILIAERVALNFLSRLSGIATLTRAYVKKIQGTSAQIFDTRKTTPTLRFLERYAVVVGGGVNHRMNLGSQVLIKDNHLKVMASRPSTVFSGRKGAGGRLAGQAGRLAGQVEVRGSVLEQAVWKVRKSIPKGSPVEVEVTDLKEFRQALAATADIVLLDNMALSDIQEAVRLRNALRRGRKGVQPLLEVSGGVTLNNVRAIADCGVDRISVGSLTHSAPILDVSLEIVG